MISVTIDNQATQVPPGTTILEAAHKLGVQIPTLCFAEGYKPTTSCMVCVVRVANAKSLVPACATRVNDGMVVTTDDASVQLARKTAIELLLSDHVGDCVGPCEKGCPTNMNIPLMIRQIVAGHFDEAIKTVKKDIAMPAVLGRICSAPCEKVCRRAQADGAVSICLLKRFVADVDLASAQPYRPDCPAVTGKKVAIVGGGPCGLSGAYYLRQAGIDCTIFDSHEKLGGALRYGDVDSHELPEEVLDNEIEQILSLGVKFVPNKKLTQDAIKALLSNHDAVLLAVGQVTDEDSEILGVDITKNKVKIGRDDFSTSQTGIFAAGRAARTACQCVRAVADGKEAADAIQAHVSGGAKKLKIPYNHQMGRLEPEEMQVFLEHVSDTGRIESVNMASGMTVKQAQAEAERCLHCDCGKADGCRLRDLATDLMARRNVWPGQRGLFKQITSAKDVIYESGKCIKCGLCVQTAKKAGEHNGLSFAGRGFEMNITVPLDKTLDEALQQAANDCVNICPTGALSYKQMIT